MGRPFLVSICRRVVAGEEGHLATRRVRRGARGGRQSRWAVFATSVPDGLACLQLGSRHTGLRGREGAPRGRCFRPKRVVGDFCEAKTGDEGWSKGLFFVVLEESAVILGETLGT